MLRRPKAGADLRSKLAAELRAQARSLAARMHGLDATEFSDADLDHLARATDTYDHRTDALDRGEPVRVSGWEVGADGPEHPHFYVLEPDGTLRPDDEASLLKRGQP